MTDGPLDVSMIVHPQLIENCVLWLYTSAGKKYIQRGGVSFVGLCRQTSREDLEPPA